MSADTVPMFSLEGKNALVTGASRGIGRAVAERFIAAGARVTITDIVDGQANADAIGADFLKMDVGSEDSVAAGLRQARETHGPLDIVVNNAGVGEVGSAFVDTQADVVERITRINQWGVLYGLKHSPAHMNDGGSIINTASLAAFVKLAGSGAYSAAKAAVSNFTQWLAVHMSKVGIRVNAIAPGSSRLTPPPNVPTQIEPLRSWCSAMMPFAASEFGLSGS